MSVTGAAVLIGLLGLTTTAVPASASYCGRVPIVDRPTIGLVLGGGGARGAAHIGVLKVLQEMRVPVDVIAGTSMGSIVGGLYATGLSGEELEAIVMKQDWENLFSDQTARKDRPFRRKRDDDFNLFGPKFGVGKGSSLLPRGAISGQKIILFFESIVGERVQTRRFDDLPIPYRAVAADIVTGDEVVLEDGDLTTAMRASMSIPAAFGPVPRGEMMLVDGGVVNNVPISVARDMGADVVIAVDVGTPLSTREELTNLVSITSQLSGLLVRGNTERQLATLSDTDVLIVPPLGDSIGASDFKQMDDAIPIGYESAASQRMALAALSVSEEDYAAHRTRIARCVTPNPTVDFVRIENDSRFRDAIIEERMHVEVGAPLDVDQLDADMAQIFALGFIEYARYVVVQEDGRTGVVVEVAQDRRGTQFLETGLDLAGNGNDSSINLRLAYLKSDVDSNGAEFRALAQFGETPGLMTELYKPFLPPLRLIFNPNLFAERRDVDQFDSSGNRLATYELTQWGGTLAVGYEFGRAAALFAGVRLFTGDTDVKVGDRSLDDAAFDGGEYVIRGRYDRLDDRYFPSSGSFVDLRFTLSDGALGADENYDQFGVSAFNARTWGHHTLIGGVKYHTTLGDDAPVHALFSGGGFFNLSGLETDEVVGQHFGMGLASYRYRLSGSGLMPAFLGGSIEYGNAAAERNDIIDDGMFNGSVYFGYRSILGPLYWGVGFAEDGKRTYFLRVGEVFGRTRFGR